MVRAKFKCAFKEGNSVRLEAVISGSEENEQFWKYTPFGQIQMSVDNEKAQEQFEEGKEYYVDFTLAE
ncbi:hypothetical protein [Paenibacillus cremeus]|uniref:Uncharacterized protein n=1 Tax=Paenibacillus cremeus TaxID=2163881 RepID=A0A559KCM7_9BACL|nr:hypothetical protein [Paenibacillus cremeus]TVY09884.1 hypothetical protein FPZ49_10960 [Paenibacillus cremeus]